MAMTASKYEVVTVGAGAASIALARADVNVMVIEGSTFLGAVYFADTLARLIKLYDLLSAEGLGLRHVRRENKGKGQQTLNERIHCIGLQW